MKVLNLTLERKTRAMVQAGVYDLPWEERSRLIKLLRFYVQPDKSQLKEQAEKISEFLSFLDNDADGVLISYGYLLPFHIYKNLLKKLKGTNKNMYLWLERVDGKLLNLEDL